VDRRFNRTWYDADKTVAAFAARLKDAIDLDAVQDDLAVVVHQAPGARPRIGVDQPTLLMSAIVGPRSRFGEVERSWGPRGSIVWLAQIVAVMPSIFGGTTEIQKEIIARGGL
jgi:hypothetical protein